jgi:dihydrodipicolinate synthase/N-acetylneuraminate lyase
MPKRESAISKIESHEKLCRIMQKQTFEQMKELNGRIARLEKILITGSGAIIIALLLNMMK